MRRREDTDGVREWVGHVAARTGDVRELVERSRTDRARAARESPKVQAGVGVESAPDDTDDTVRRVAQLEETVARTHERAAELYESWLERQVGREPADLQRRAQRHRQVAAAARSAEWLAERTLREFRMRIETRTSRTGKARHLVVLSALERLRLLVNSWIAETVGVSRQEGATWAEIAGALGVSRQTAHERFRHR